MYVRVCVCVCVFVLHSSTWGINKNLLINVQFNFVLLLISGLGSASLAGSSSSPLPSSPASSSSLQRLPSAIYATYSHMDFISFMRSFFSFFLSCLLLYSFVASALAWIPYPLRETLVSGLFLTLWRLLLLLLLFSRASPQS